MATWLRAALLAALPWLGTSAPEVVAPAVGGLVPVWTFCDPSGCLQTHVNYLALWVTMKGTGIDTGAPSGNITEGKTCAEQGFTNQTHVLEDPAVPAVIRAAYAGVTSWAKPLPDGVGLRQSGKGSGTQDVHV